MHKQVLKLNWGAGKRQPSQTPPACIASPVPTPPCRAQCDSSLAGLHAPARHLLQKNWGPRAPTGSHGCFPQHPSPSSRTPSLLTPISNPGQHGGQRSGGLVGGSTASGLSAQVYLIIYFTLTHAYLQPFQEGRNGALENGGSEGRGGAPLLPPGCAPKLLEAQADTLSTPGLLFPAVPC